MAVSGAPHHEAPKRKGEWDLRCALLRASRRKINIERGVCSLERHRKLDWHRQAAMARLERAKTRRAHCVGSTGAREQPGSRVTCATGGWRRKRKRGREAQSRADVLVPGEGEAPTTPLVTPSFILLWQVCRAAREWVRRLQSNFLKQQMVDPYGAQSV